MSISSNLFYLHVLRIIFPSSLIFSSLKPVFSYVVLFNRERSVVIRLALLIARWPLKMSDYPLVAPRVFCDVNGGNRIKNGHAVEFTV